MRGCLIHSATAKEYFPSSSAVARHQHQTLSPYDASSMLRRRPTRLDFNDTSSRERVSTTSSPHLQRAELRRRQSARIKQTPN